MQNATCCAHPVPTVTCLFTPALSLLGEAAAAGWLSAGPAAGTPQEGTPMQGKDLSSRCQKAMALVMIRSWDLLPVRVVLVLFSLEGNFPYLCGDVVGFLVETLSVGFLPMDPRAPATFAAGCDHCFRWVFRLGNICWDKLS